MIIDAWMQHPNAEWIRNPMFDSLRRWKPGRWSETSQPIEATMVGVETTARRPALRSAVCELGEASRAAFLADNARRVFKLE